MVFAIQQALTIREVPKSIGSYGARQPMLRICFSGATFLLSAGASLGQPLKENCQTQGTTFHLDQNRKVTIDTQMDENGCRDIYRNNWSSSDRVHFVFEKAVIAKEPAHGILSQPGKFPSFYRPSKGFKGTDTLVVYICGSAPAGAGCARLT